MTSNITDVRKRAWETRRKKYGPMGHRGYRRQVANYDGMLSLIIRLHNEGTLSEGQVAKATGLHRIEVRRLADEVYPEGRV